MLCERPTIDAKQIGLRIRAARRSRRWRLEQLADATGAAVSTVGAWERGYREPRGAETWARLSSALRRSLDWLIFGAAKNARSRRNELSDEAECTSSGSIGAGRQSPDPPPV